MNGIFSCPPAFLPWLTGSLFGLFVGGGIGFWIRGYSVSGQPWSHSQEFPVDGGSGGL